MNVHERLARIGDIDQRIARRRHFRETAAEHDQEIGVLHRVAELGIDADADIAGVIRMRMVEQHLAAEGDGNRQIPGFGEGLEGGDRGFGPARAAENDQRTLGLFQPRLEVSDLARRRMGGDRLIGRASAATTRSVSISSGSDRTTGPGRPDVATARRG